MSIKGIELAWITVKDFEAAVRFYTETVGLTLLEKNVEYGWAELSGPEGTRLGIAKEDGEMKAGHNAIPAITVANIDTAREDLKNKGAKLIGDVLIIPGEVKLQTFCDADGNQMQLVQQL